MTRELLVIGIGLVAIVSCAWLLNSARRSSYGHGLGPQLAVAAVCGLIGALIASIPYVDTVPDDLETTSTAIVAVVALVAIAAVTVLVIRRRGRAHDRDGAVPPVSRRPESRPPETRPPETRPVVVAPSPPLCQVCGGVANVVDHLAGPDDRDVAVLRCWTCSEIASTA